MNIKLKAALLVPVAIIATISFVGIILYGTNHLKVFVPIWIVVNAFCFYKGILGFLEERKSGLNRK